MRAKALAINYISEKTERTFSLPITLFKKPTNDKEYAELEAMLDKLIDEVGNDDKHCLVDVMQIIGDNLEQYDDEHGKKIGEDISEIDIVKYLMAEHNLRQKDLASLFGSQANVSKFLNGERSLSKRQIAGLKQKFSISADFFI